MFILWQNMSFDQLEHAQGPIYITKQKKNFNSGEYDRIQ